MRWVLTGLLVLPWVVSAQEWKDRLEVFASVKSMQAEQGYQVLSSLPGEVVKDVAKPEPVNAKAAVEFEGKRYYMSDWSWSRYQRGKAPYWILLRGAEEPEKPVEPLKPAEGEEERAVAVAAEPAVPAVPAEPVEKPASAPKDETSELAEKIGQKWEGVLEVFPDVRDVPAPKGHKLLATPDRGEKALKSTSTKSSITVQAALTRKDGYVYYISDWSWSRAKVGKEPSWMFVTGDKPRTAPVLAGEQPGKKLDQSPAPDAPPAAASLMEKAKQLVRPKLTLDGMDASGRVVALLVGNARYSSVNPAQQMLDLQDPPANLELLGRTLRTLNVEVREEKDLNREQLTRVLQDTVSGLHKGDVFLFYYAGHALQLGGKNYLVPLGINFLDRKTVRDSAYGLEGFWKIAAEKSLRFVALFLDGCRKNPFNAKDPAFYILSRIPGLNFPADSGSKPGLAEEKPPRDALVSFAADPGAVMADPVPGSHISRYAEALAGALAENLEIRETLKQVNRRVSEGTGRRQLPWSAAGDFPAFFLHTPGRSTLDPDQAVERAGEWVRREKEKGLPIALGLLARSVRERPAKNPATAGLLFLLGYQAIPLPVKSWGPFPAVDGPYAGELQLSIDGRYVALFPAKEEKPTLILDREKGETISEAYESFAPGYGKVSIVVDHPGAGNGGAGDLRVISFHRKPEGAEAKLGAEVVHAMTPLLLRGELIASFYDGGLERLFLALRDTDKTVTFWEYGTTPPVGCHEDLRVVATKLDFPKEGTVTLAEGSVPSASGDPGQPWKLQFDGPSGEVRFLRGSEQVYRRPMASQPEQRLDDWRLDNPARKLVLVFRNHVDVLGLDGAVASQFDLPPSADMGRRVLSFNAAFRRLVLAWGAPAKPHEEGAQEITFYDLSTGRRIGGAETLAGFGEFAGLSPDQEWFLYYDSARRIRLVDMISGGARLHLPGTATLEPLPVGSGLEPNTEVDFPAFELSSPPALMITGESSKAPPWLADLAEALIGFQVNENSEVEWLTDAPKRLEAATQQMRNRPGEEAQKAWAKWLLANRLGHEGS